MKKQTYLVVTGYGYPCFQSTTGFVSTEVKDAWTTDYFTAAQRVADGLNAARPDEWAPEYRVEMASEFAV